MARNGSGTHSIPNTFVSGNSITASGHNQNFSDVSAEITNSVAADGQTSMTGPLKAANGTAGAPSVTFASDTNTGWYRAAANSIAVALDGVDALVLATATAAFAANVAIASACAVAGIITAGNGAVGAPGFSFGSDPDSGIYRIGANNIGAAVNGAKVLDIATTGLSVTGTLASTGALTVSANGANITGGLTVATGGLTVSAGSVSLPAGSVANAALAAPGAMVLIQTQAASSSATIDFTTGLNDTYDAYKLIITGVKPATDDVDLWLRVGTAGPTYQTSLYRYGASSANDGAAGTSNWNATSGSSIVMTGLAIAAGNGMGNAAGESGSFEITFSNPESTDFHDFYWTGAYRRANSTVGAGLVGGGSWDSNTAIVAIRLMMSSGNIASGRFTLYGLTKA